MATKKVSSKSSAKVAPKAAASKSSKVMTKVAATKIAAKMSKAAPKTKSESKKPLPAKGKPSHSAVKKISEAAKFLLGRKTKPETPKRLKSVSTKKEVAQKATTLPKTPVKATVKAAKAKAAAAAVTKAKVTPEKAPPTVPVALAKSKTKPGTKLAGGRNANGILKKADNSEVICREIACEGLSTTGGYCRLHYIKNWRKIKRKEVILEEKKLNQYIEELVTKYPDKYIEAILQDLATDKEFAKVIRDLDLDEGPDEEFDEDSDSDVIIDSIKREFEEDTEGF